MTTHKKETWEKKIRSLTYKYAFNLYDYYAWLFIGKYKDKKDPKPDSHCRAKLSSELISLFSSLLSLHQAELQKEYNERLATEVAARISTIEQQKTVWKAEFKKEIEGMKIKDYHKQIKLPTYHRIATSDELVAYEQALSDVLALLNSKKEKGI
jgi:hypothetical protein